MRVLLANSLLSDRGGAHRWLLGLLKRLQGRVETLLAVGQVDRKLPQRERQRVGALVRIRGLDRRGLRGGGAPEAALEALGRTLDRFDPQVVHVNDVTDPHLLQRLAHSGRAVMTVQDHRFFCPGRGQVDAAGLPCPDVLGDHCLRCFEDPVYGQTLLALTRRRLQAVAGMARITVLSRYMRRQLSAAGVAPGRITVLPPFVDGLPAPPAGEPRRDAGDYHLLAGRLSQHKGLQVALEALELLRTRLPLRVAGDGPLAGDVARQAGVSGGRLRYQGWADREQLGRLLQGARCLWLPGVWAEPFGIVGLEALSCGVPVIASRVGGVPEWLDHGRQGLLVEPGSAAELARAADRLADDPRLALELGQAGQRRVAQEFDPGRQVDRLLKIYAEVSRV
jgi:glycosyltransferase involved in cell wall biosynthesis